MCIRDRLRSWECNSGCHRVWPILLRAGASLPADPDQFMKYLPRQYMQKVIDAGGWANYERRHLDKLAAIPSADVRRMQATLEQHAHKLQYAVDDVHDDAFETLLKGALMVARSRHAALFPGGDDDARGEQPEEPGAG